MPRTINSVLRILSLYGWLFCLGACQIGCTNQDSSSVHASIAQLKKGDHRSRLQAFAELRKLGANAKPAIPILMKMMEDEDSDIRSAASETLGAIGPDAGTAVPTLISTLKHDNDRYVRGACAKALGKIGVKDKRVLAALERALTDADCKVQDDAAVALTVLDPDNENAISTLVMLLKDKDEDARDRAVRSLGKIESTKIKTAIPALIKALKDPEDGVRIGAAISLGKICEESEKVVPALVERVNNEQAFLVRVMVVQALGEYGPEAKAAIPALTRALNDPEHQVRVAAAQSLDYIKTWKKRRGQKGINEEAEAIRKRNKEIEEEIENER